jgi:large subunit ribosomal protein L47
MGFDEFFDQKEKPGDEVATGRAWTAADLRRKSFDDIHKLWFVLYKERNLLLSERERTRRNNRPVLAKEEDRYTKVKRSMGAIKFVLKERSKIKKMLEAEGVEELADTKTQN